MTKEELIEMLDEASIFSVSYAELKSDTRQKVDALFGDILATNEDEKSEEYDQGYDSGHSDGMLEGYDDGFEDGKAEAEEEAAS